MFAYSLYCRTLFTGAFPPKNKEGLTIIDLSCFSKEVVQVFLDMMYGMKREDAIDIDVEELLKLADFMQADSNIPLITETLRHMLDVDNCLEIYNLAGAYNFSKLQTVTLTFISGNLQKLTKTDAWKTLDGETLLSLLKEPMIQCKPETLVGEGWKQCFSGKSDCDILMGVNFKEECVRKTPTFFLREPSSIISVQRHVIDEEVHKLYFVFGKELFYIMMFKGNMLIFKYNQNSKLFVPNLPNAVIKSVNKMNVLFVLVTEGNTEDVTLMCIPSTAQYGEEKKFSLVKVSLVGEVEDITQITTTFKVQDFNVVGSSKCRKICFFGERVLHIYNIASGTCTTNITIQNILLGEIKHYFEFRGNPYAATHDKSFLRIYRLEKPFGWKLCLEREMEMDVVRLKSCSSFNECAIILESKDDSSDHIYKMDFDPMEIRHFKTSKKLSEYLFVPEHICL